MKAREILDWAKLNDLDEKEVLSTVKKAVRENRTSFQAVELSTGEENSVEYTYYGYRKYATDEYVSNAYRNKFGWKNTYYQNAILKITFKK